MTAIAPRPSCLGVLEQVVDARSSSRATSSCACGGRRRSSRDRRADRRSGAGRGAAARAPSRRAARGRRRRRRTRGRSRGRAPASTCRAEASSTRREQRRRCELRLIRETGRLDDGAAGGGSLGSQAGRAAQRGDEDRQPRGARAPARPASVAVRTRARPRSVEADAGTDCAAAGAQHDHLPVRQAAQGPQRRPDDAEARRGGLDDDQRSLLPGREQVEVDAERDDLELPGEALLRPLGDLGGRRREDVDARQEPVAVVPARRVAEPLAAREVGERARLGVEEREVAETRRRGVDRVDDVEGPDLERRAAASPGRRREPAAARATTRGSPGRSPRPRRAPRPGRPACRGTGRRPATTTRARPPCGPGGAGRRRRRRRGRSPRAAATTGTGVTRQIRSGTAPRFYGPARPLPGRRVRTGRLAA